MRPASRQVYEVSVVSTRDETEATVKAEAQLRKKLPLVTAGPLVLCTLLSGRYWHSGTP